MGVTSSDPTLSFLAAVGLAASVGTALVVDLVGDIDTRRTVADLSDEGPRLTELSPGRAGVAILGRGAAADDQLADVVGDLTRSWPYVVIRCSTGPTAGWGVAPVRHLLPGLLQTKSTTPAVWQPLSGSVKPPGPGPVLPRLPARQARSMLSGRLPRRSRWIRAWRPVWGLPWA